MDVERAEQSAASHQSSALALGRTGLLGLLAGIKLIVEKRRDLAAS